MKRSKPIKRYYDEDKFARLQEDFAFLIERVIASRGELDFRLRDNYFNLYNRGNALAKVTTLQRGYSIEISRPFVESVQGRDPRFADRFTGTVKSKWRIRLESDDLHAFFQAKYLNLMCSLIKERGFSEEITYEQAIITDNMGRPDVLIIDRQVQGGPLGSKELDLLLLELDAKDGNSFRPTVVEIKLGNDSRLSSEVADQLGQYVDALRRDQRQFKDCYERVFNQMRRLGLMGQIDSDSINITGEVQGWVLVVGYSGLAKPQMQSLRSHHPDIQFGTMFLKWPPVVRTSD